MDKIDYLSCRCSIDFAENKDLNFLSLNYDDELEINDKDRKVKIKETALCQYNLTLVGDIKKAKLTIFLPEILAMFVINVFLSLAQSAFVFEGFFSFGAEYWKYMLFQATFLSTMIATFYNFIWTIFSRKKQLDYYGRIGSTINSLRPHKCGFEDAKRSVLLVLDNAYIYGDNECFKKLPYKKQYLGILKTAVIHNKKVSQYEYEYGKALSSITNKGSLLFAIIGAILSVLVLAFTFLDTWSSVGDEFHLNMIVTTVLSTLVVPLLLYRFISDYYYKRIMELESLYCLYSYQYLDMPYSEKTTSFSFNFSKYKELGPSFEREFVLSFIKAFNESIFYKISIRDVKIDDSYKISILGFSPNEISSNLFKEMVASVYEKMDILYRFYSHNC